MSITRRTFLGAAATAAIAGASAAPDFRINRDVRITVPEKAIGDAFGIAARLVEDMRRLAYEHYGKDGLLAVSDGKNGPQHSYDPRDFHFGPKCAAYLYGHDRQFAIDMGARIFKEQTDPSDGRLIWDPTGQTAIHLAQTAKYWSDYMVYAGQDATVRGSWDRILQTIKWGMATYDPNHDGLIEHGTKVPDNFWALLVGEPLNFPRVEGCSQDVVVLATMDVCELLRVSAAHASAHGLAGAEWLGSHAAQTHTAIETSAWDPDAEYYYLLYRKPDRRWQHSINCLNEESRELDATPYYAAMTSGNFSRAVRVAAYARRVLLERGLFPMPLQYPPYAWESPHYRHAHDFIEGGCWEESYYNCVRAWSECRMRDAVYEAVRRRSEAYARDGECIEWYTQQKGLARGRDRYGISAAAHVAAVIEGLFGITPAAAGFEKIHIRPNLPVKWAGQNCSVRVTLPDDGFLEYSHLYDTTKNTVTVKAASNKEREGRFRVFVPMPVTSVKWNSVSTRYESAQLADGGFVVSLDRPFQQQGLLEIAVAPAL
jgi:hypothetical protein